MLHDIKFGQLALATRHLILLRAEHTAQTHCLVEVASPFQKHGVLSVEALLQLFAVLRFSGQACTQLLQSA